MVRAAELSPKALIEALEQGDFYASSGVELRDVRFDALAKRLDVEIATREDVTYVTEFIGTRRGYDKASEAIVDDKGEPIVATRKYSADVGQVLAKVEGAKASYTLKGDELYVRAVVTASEKAENPAFEGQRRQAWTQPVGWTLKTEK
jgi:hypothetical protein